MKIKKDRITRQKFFQGIGNYQAQSALDFEKKYSGRKMEYFRTFYVFPFKKRYSIHILNSKGHIIDGRRFYPVK